MYAWQPDKKTPATGSPALLFGAAGVGAAVFGVADENFAAVGQLHGTRVAGVAGVFGAEAFNGDFIAGLQRVLAPALAGEAVGRAAFALPVLHSAALILHVEIQPDV